jgi:hypothetical protein
MIFAEQHSMVQSSAQRCASPCVLDANANTRKRAVKLPLRERPTALI